MIRLTPIRLDESPGTETGARMLDDLRQDLKYAVRALLKNYFIRK